MIRPRVRYRLWGLGKRMARGAALAFVLLAYGVSSLQHIPSPAYLLRSASRAVEGHQRFPCEAGSCGCSTAERCWSSCCCHTRHQQLVWALLNGVLPPDSISITDDEWIAAANSVREGSAHCSSCVDRIKADLALGIAMQGDATWGDGQLADIGGCCGESEQIAEARTPSDRVARAAQDADSRFNLPTLSPLGCRGVEQVIAAGFIAIKLSEREIIIPDTTGVPIAALPVSIPASHLLEPIPPPPRA